jgi:hypothetical protein
MSSCPDMSCADRVLVHQDGSEDVSSRRQMKLSYLLFGDNKALHEFTNHYGSVKARCLVKDCKCCKNDYTTFPSKCRFPDWAELIQCKTANQAFDLFEKCNLVSYRDISRAKEDPDFAKHISKHATVDNAFETLPLADRFLGIIGITPQEFLQTWAVECTFIGSLLSERLWERTPRILGPKVTLMNSLLI